MSVENSPGLHYIKECEVCKGEGRYEQIYTVGCGMGSYKSMGPCDWCKQVGYMDKRFNAPASAIEIASHFRKLLAAERLKKGESQ